MNRIVIFILLVLALSSCSKRVLTSTNTVTTRERVLTDTLVHITVNVPIKSIQVDTTVTAIHASKDIHIHKETKDMTVDVHIDTAGRITIDARTKADSLRAIVKLQRERITVLTETVKEYERKETPFKKVVKQVGFWLVCLVVCGVIVVVVIWKLKKTIL